MEMTDKFGVSDLMTWVENQTGAVVVLGDLRRITYEIPGLQLRSDQHLHHGPYCEFAKINGHLAQCIADNKQIYRRAERGVPFESICPLGLWEWIEPVVFKNDLMVVLLLGSLRTGTKLPKVAGRTYSGGAVPACSKALKRSLRSYARLLRDVILLIIEEWVRTGNRLSKQKPIEFYRDVTMLHIRNHYHEKVRLQDLARQLHLHPYYLGRIIRKAYGKDFKKLLMEYRIERAKFMFAAERRSVTEVAYACGFNDGNYFSTVFRKLAGLSPRKFLNTRDVACK